MPSVFSAEKLELQAFPEGEQTAAEFQLLLSVNIRELQTSFHKHRTPSAEDVAPESGPDFKKVRTVKGFPANVAFVALRLSHLCACNRVTCKKKM